MRHEPNIGTVDPLLREMMGLRIGYRTSDPGMSPRRKVQDVVV